MPFGQFSALMLHTTWTHLGFFGSPPVPPTIGGFFGFQPGGAGLPILTGGLGPGLTGGFGSFLAGFGSF
jgi:hypothetical protein